MNYQLKELNDARLNRLKAIEKELGCCIVAFEPKAEPAPLSDAQLKRLQELENEIGAVLVAYSCEM